MVVAKVVIPMVCRRCGEQFKTNEAVERLHWPRGQTPPHRFCTFAATCGTIGAVMLLIAVRCDMWQLGLLSGAPLVGSAYAFGHAILAWHDYRRVRCPNCGERAWQAEGLR